MSANGKTKDLSPQQSAFKEAYLNPTSATFGNALQSAINAGFSKDYAKRITASGNDWFAEIIRDKEMLDNAEKLLSKTITDGMVSNDSQDKKLGQDSAKFVSSRLGKKKWADRTEHTGKDGKDLPTPILAINTDAILPNDSDKQSISTPQKD